MLSIDYIRQNKEKVIEAAKNKKREVDIDHLLELDDKRRSLISEVQTIRTKRNELSDRNEKPTKEKIEEGKNVKNQLKKIEDELKRIEEEYNDIMLHVPNVPLDEVPVGKDESSNVEIKKWGEPRVFDFEPKSHIELGESLNIVDFHKGSDVSGFRGYFLKNQLALIHMALLWYVFRKLTLKGYMPIIAPSIVKEFTLFGSGHFPWARKDDVYSLNDPDSYLAGTAEVPTMAYHKDKVYEEKNLPLKFVAMSDCFRREAGAYGKDTKGLYRVHEFWKIEQVILAKNNLDEARVLHEELQQNCEEILQELELPYRVVLMCTGEMGEPQVFKYDTETWMPSRNSYGETMSNSIMGDFQCRRLNIRYKTREGGKTFCYSLNNTALASPRILIALLENHQQKDGSILLPKVLHDVVGFDTIVRI
ncbi:serine--tRNA ligase [Candidatus Roizmanbacteria bacterium RIFCSPLOWO2_02_FULL_37_19]|uniref:Serine--tRNA ligase n=1 Tax=Candidatus Roizmanbacteria bacterium RIFCSPHIGHO2_02_FULL_37_24 TaxID=1802037 RepID=A0A1F7H1L2_9BACT|nr:MAG: serine--tRNA ligase [Candidatus Roizmanbacteria bacterium RIFCSPHIGHO2_01_FULL_38_41]OGK24756.1 MAG: serine--tRNA ligase [Candidatus Roizmanbacteria bacterium RIFCSPHIGHO2_02_FULL_37_24]OGK31900.1 MAG: serine--tRNA ligase [Candidatus Roizmanbacteria bacterium RIFCSPHIGHO2_12_FULL_37_23]OGK45056.1 MAG: serine--tRNA ligase [Candidatus Roizmanbacteria bacterium RIFCSPLOWO2_01_FULL_37_57]OGK53917.1 MAG: serine--tRNA ligase [Candidatus Roizmanbacteria bacterium RIFCSPLOWO2_02_FULL_37_19]OGK